MRRADATTPPRRRTGPSSSARNRCCMPPTSADGPRAGTLPTPTHTRQRRLAPRRPQPLAPSQPRAPGISLSRTVLHMWTTNPRVGKDVLPLGFRIGIPIRHIWRLTQELARLLAARLPTFQQSIGERPTPVLGKAVRPLSFAFGIPNDIWATNHELARMLDHSASRLAFH